MTAATEKQIRMAAQLYEIRETAKQLLGDVFKARMAELGAVLTEVAQREKVEPLAVAIRFSKDPKHKGTNALMVIAAAVELAEPST